MLQYQHLRRGHHAELPDQLGAGELLGSRLGWAIAAMLDFACIVSRNREVASEQDLDGDGVKNVSYATRASGQE